MLMNLPNKIYPKTSQDATLIYFESSFMLSKKIIYFTESFGLEFNPRKSELSEPFRTNPKNVLNLVRCKSVKTDLSQSVLFGFHPNQPELGFI